MNRINDLSGLADRYDLVIIGAGPAGLSAARTATGFGLSVLVADESLSPGGQIYRSITTSPVKKREILGEDYWSGAALVDGLTRSNADYASRATIWSVTAIEDSAEGTAFELGISIAGMARLIETRRVILATGALERPFPIRGWTLPGVMSAGAAQIALKSSGIVPSGRTVIAGCGPLLYVLAAQLHAAGAEITAVLDTAPRGNWLAALPALPGFLSSPYFVKGLKLLSATRRKLRHLTGVTGLAASGGQQLEGITLERRGRSEMIACDILLLHHGVIPNVNMANALGCAHRFDEDQRCFVPTTDAWFNASVPGIAIAGDGAGIGGAEAAIFRGEIAGLEAAHQLVAIDAGERDRRVAPIRRAHARAMRGRRFLDLLYKPAAQFLAPPDADTIVCRCEEVRAGEVRETVLKLDVTGPNQLKAFLRCGMGPCQGRLCGPTITEIIARTRDVSCAETGYYRLRPPVKPVTLAELANLPQSDAAKKAVIR